MHIFAKYVIISQYIYEVYNSKNFLNALCNAEQR